ncbi:MAG: thiol:disulfide interchange protein DsbA/DsbL, partial [Betaproteobacteria bacterium]|nr:thiol:disulfide interchange protein DsbA/DsbL [Betaproteobacteria bacterium]
PRAAARLAQPRNPTVGVDYSELRPALPTEASGKVEVLEFFWYGCPHCYTLEPLLEKWIPRLPADVQFQRVPAVFNDNWARDAAVYYTFEALGLLERLHRPYFDAIHRDRVNTRDQSARNDWLQKNGVDVKRFEEAYKSFGVQSKVRRAQQLSVAYRIDGTPALAVQGRYTISAEQGRTQQGMLGIADYLIGVARKGG